MKESESLRLSIDIVRNGIEWCETDCNCHFCSSMREVLSAAEKHNEYEKTRDDWASTMEQAAKQEKDRAAWNRRTDNG